jgi:hypothetical protein
MFLLSGKPLCKQDLAGRTLCAGRRFVNIVPENEKASRVRARPGARSVIVYFGSRVQGSAWNPLNSKSEPTVTG